MQELEEQLVEQGQRNSELSLRLEETLMLKQETDDNLRGIVGRSQQHEQDLAKFQMEVQLLTLSDAQSRAECERLR